MAISNETGLRDILRGDSDLEAQAVEQFCRASEIANLFVLPSGSGSEESSGLLYSPRLKALLDRLTHEFDVVLVDTPPMLHMADARIAAGVTDGVILVFRARTTDRRTAVNARDLFHHDRVRVVGTILNDFDPLAEGESDYYSSYYQYQDASGKGSGELREA
jgi:Mrp family chromosome partitioning ATPase